MRKECRWQTETKAGRWLFAVHHENSLQDVRRFEFWKAKTQRIRILCTVAKVETSLAFTSTQCNPTRRTSISTASGSAMGIAVRAITERQSRRLSNPQQMSPAAFSKKDRSVGVDIASIIASSSDYKLTGARGGFPLVLLFRFPRTSTSRTFFDIRKLARQRFPTHEVLRNATPDAMRVVQKPPQTPQTSSTLRYSQRGSIEREMGPWHQFPEAQPVESVPDMHSSKWKWREPKVRKEGTEEKNDGLRRNQSPKELRSQS